MNALTFTRENAGHRSPSLEAWALLARHSMRAPVLASVALCLLVPTALNGCRTKSCTAVGCASTVTATLDVPVMASALEGKLLQICRGDQCVKADVFFRDGQLICIAAPPVADGASAGCEATLEPIAAGVRIHPQYRLAYKEKVAEGDAFTASLVDTKLRTTLAEARGTLANVRVWYPNGQECDEEDGYQCYSARF